MISGKTAIMGLRYLCGFVIVFGVAAACYGFIYKFTIPLFAFDVPSWIIGVSAAYMGVKHYRRIPELEKKVDLIGKFSWRNFSIGGAKARSGRA